MYHLETPSRGGHHACTAVTHTPVPANLLDHGGGGGPGVAIWLAGGRRWLAGGRRGPEGGSSQDPSPLLRGFLMSQQNPQGCRPKLAERQLLKPRRLQPRSPDGGPTLHSGLFICLRKSALPKLKKKKISLNLKWRKQMLKMPSYSVALKHDMLRSYSPSRIPFAANQKPARSAPGSNHSQHLLRSWSRGPSSEPVHFQTCSMSS